MLWERLSTFPSRQWENAVHSDHSRPGDVPRERGPHHARHVCRRASTGHALCWVLGLQPRERHGFSLQGAHSCRGHDGSVHCNVAGSPASGGDGVACGHSREGPLVWMRLAANLEARTGMPGAAWEVPSLLAGEWGMRQGGKYQGSCLLEPASPWEEDASSCQGNREPVWNACLWAIPVRTRQLGHLGVNSQHSSTKYAPQGFNSLALLTCAQVIDSSMGKQNPQELWGKSLCWLLVLGLQLVWSSKGGRGHGQDAHYVHPRVTPLPVVVFKRLILPFKLKHKPVQRQRPPPCLLTSSPTQYCHMFSQHPVPCNRPGVWNS